MQKLTKLVFASAALAFMITSTAGAAVVSRATLAAPLAAPKLIIIDGKVWKCTVVDCVTADEGRPQPLKRECARAVKFLGKVTAFGRSGVFLSEEQLAVCNAGV